MVAYVGVAVCIRCGCGTDVGCIDVVVGVSGVASDVDVDMVVAGVGVDAYVVGGCVIRGGCVVGVGCSGLDAIGCGIYDGRVGCYGYGIGVVGVLTPLVLFVRSLLSVVSVLVVLSIVVVCLVVVLNFMWLVG